METATASAPAAASTETASAPGTQDPSAAQGQAPKAQSSPAKPEFYEYKIDGKMVKLSREERDQYVSLGHASDKRFKEGAQMRKQAETVLGRFKDPSKVMDALMDPALGLSKDQIREAFEGWYAKEFIEPESLSPSEKRAREAEARLKKYEEQDKEREDQKLKDQQEAMTSQARQELQAQIIQVLETSGLPKTNFTIRRLAYWMQRNNANGYNAPPEVVANQVRNEFNSSIRDMVDNSDGETLIKLLGDSITSKLRKYDLEQLRKTRSQPAVTQQQETSPGLPKSERAPTSSDVNQRIRQLQKTGRY